MGVDSIRNGERLRRLEALTDATLSRLDASDLLDELLDRVRDLLGADTAAILLVDPHSQQLVATAARGLEEEVRRGVRIPIGRGFAGRVAQERVPLMLADFTSADVVNPVLVEMGIRALLGVPIIAAGEVVGVLHVGSLQPRGSPPTTYACWSWLPTAPAWPARSVHRKSSRPPRSRCSAACCRAPCPRCRASGWPPATFPATRSASAATGMTCSRCPPAGWAW
ncbi:GAF domain-containing protein [Paractinoplanes durhamensis]|uniref:GAF domain-containing protein n=1 Tax=Paractinoplanes durhamensis TaxID=113563 RepID=UPI00362BDC2A